MITVGCRRLARSNYRDQEPVCQHVAVEPMPEALSALLARPDPSAPALVTAENGAALSFGQLADRVDALAARLAAIGVERGDRVAVTLGSGPDFVQILLAITTLGAAAAPLNPAYTRSEYLFYLEDIAPRMLLVPASRPE